jgi:hypothetical protein
MRHVAAPKPTLAERRGLKLRNTWKRRSSTQEGGEARGHGTRGSTGAHLSKEVRFGATEHVAAPEPTSAWRCGPKLQLVWWRVYARPAPCLDLELVCGVPDLQGANRGPRAHLGRGYEPAGGANFSTPRSIILSFYSAVEGAPTTNVKTSTTSPREMPELKVQERPPSTRKHRQRAPGRCRS